MVPLPAPYGLPVDRPCFEETYLNYIPLVSIFKGIFDLVNFNSDTVVMVSLGYYVELNDRHLVEWIAIFIPVLGNIVMAVFACYRECCTSDNSPPLSNTALSYSSATALGGTAAPPTQKRGKRVYPTSLLPQNGGLSNTSA
jgi:hypothetical protein